MLWLCLRFPWLPLEVFTRGDTRESGGETRSVAIVEKGRVLCANDAATRHGIGPGLSSATAQALCAELRVRERAATLEAEALSSLADWAWRFTPQLQLLPPERLLLEISASLKLFGGLGMLLRAVEADLAAWRWTHGCGLAPTPLAAELLARAHPCTAASLPAWCRPGGPDFANLLGELPLALLEAPAREQQTMQRMGFRRVGELLALPRAALGRRFGREFLRYLMRLCGELPDPRPTHRPREHFESALHFLDPVPDTAMLLFPMHRLLGELTQFLARCQAFCQRIEWQLCPAHGAMTTLPIACSLEQHRESALLELTRLALEGLRLAEPVVSLALSCREFAPLHGQSAELFDDTAQAGLDAERRLLDRLRLRLGERDLHGLQLADAHLPEQAWSTTPARAATPAGGQRPCWLLREPAPVTHGARGLDWNGSTLELLGGPERIENGWWTYARARDYFVARAQDGAVLWVYRERTSGRWYLQGLFG